ncbi:cyclodeaminase/cyclohydrolase family protein [Neolewinella antarctica]|uniref:Formiminotetrahydrofolate cyclodeaminase n=1 Tax=Neolewinella antarctica TaxID=442734 RepID=A0ABX0XH42_9BACT|nr:cyclodeaminase/cyclohydrolase family protein [Neolewinella antarctica]NJC28191.1 formiminotetrahydrofolate cyclodeaminase [Neolewinella antarctica]
MENYTKIAHKSSAIFALQTKSQMSPLLQLPTSELLEKFGAGNHKPGSGSAAALNGLLACEFIATVIQLTIDPGRGSKYKSIIGRCRETLVSIENKIRPRLMELFQEDSTQFDKTIKLRIQRNKAENQKIKNSRNKECLKALYKSTQIPIEIAELGVKLADFALFIAKEGFQSARGDSSVALENAIACVSGCISIVALNLSSFIGCSWTTSVKQKLKEFKNNLQRLQKSSHELQDNLEEEADRKNEVSAIFREFRSRYKAKLFISDNDIQGLVKDLQNTLWKYRDIIFSKKIPRNHIDVLRPSVVLNRLDYAFQEVETLGSADDYHEIGGIIDNRVDKVTISKMYPKEVQLFTAAHELGHALLHKGVVFHRDLPLSSPTESTNRPIEEIQSDKFAAYFLMPEKIVREIFFALLGVESVQMNESTAKCLGNMSLRDFRMKVKCCRDLSREVAKTEYFNFQPFNSLHKIFNVSVEAMAIRLEELGLVS